jgi:hypothetical protein
MKPPLREFLSPLATVFIGIAVGCLASAYFHGFGDVEVSRHRVICGLMCLVIAGVALVHRVLRLILEELRRR